MITAEDIASKKQNKIISIGVDATIHDALKVMSVNKIGAILLTKDGKIVGIWTERDLMRNIMECDFDMKTARIGDYMTSKLQSSKHTETIYQLMDKFLGLRLRHLLVEKKGEYIGLLSAGDIMKACLQDKNSQIKELNAIVSWEYYEEWKRREDSTPLTK